MWLSGISVSLTYIPPQLSISMQWDSGKVNKRGQRASSCGRPFLNCTVSDVSTPFSVFAMILVLQLVDSFCKTSQYHDGNLCRLKISISQWCSEESYALATPTQAMLRLRLPRCASWSTIRSISKLSMEPLHFSLAPRWSPCISPCSFRSGYSSWWLEMRKSSSTFQSRR